ncbi:MAG: DUF1311 domain-containing protein [Nitrospinae bacterium]|nr:DUF1311 domain-containing protein [Nitrospinota bacterium]
MATITKTTLILCTAVVILSCPVAWEKVWAENCLDTPIQPEMNLCASNVTKKADLELEAVYKKLMKKIDLENQAKLRSAQSAWIVYRKKQCEFNTAGTVGGSVHPTVLSYCYADFANQQKKILQGQLECEEGNLSCGGQ